MGRAWVGMGVPKPRAVIYGQASGVPSPPPPPQWYGLPGVWGGGGWRVRKGVGAVWSCRWMVGVLAARATRNASPSQASRKPYSAACAPVSSNLNLHPKPYTQP